MISANPDDDVKPPRAHRLEQIIAQQQQVEEELRVELAIAECLVAEQAASLAAKD